MLVVKIVEKRFRTHGLRILEAWTWVSMTNPSLMVLRSITTYWMRQKRGWKWLMDFSKGVWKVRNIFHLGKLIWRKYCPENLTERLVALSRDTCFIIRTTGTRTGCAPCMLMIDLHFSSPQPRSRSAHGVKDDICRYVGLNVLRLKIDNFYRRHCAGRALIWWVGGSWSPEAIMMTEYKGHFMSRRSGSNLQAQFNAFS